MTHNLKIIATHPEVKNIFSDETLFRQVIYKQRLCDELNMINDELLHPCSSGWGKLTREESENGFLDIDHELHEEWGTKSFNILHFISALRHTDKPSPHSRENDSYDDWVDYAIGDGMTAWEIM